MDKELDKLIGKALKGTATVKELREAAKKYPEFADLFEEWADELEFDGY